jgi:hypothetical protein
MNKHCFESCDGRNPGKKPLLALRAAIMLALAVASVSTPAAAQSSNGQETKPIQQEPADQDFINPDRPGIADGSNVVGRGRFQAETGIQQEFRRDGESREHTLFAPTLLRFGIGSRWEARVEGNTFTSVRTFDPTTETSRSSGFAPISIGVKYHIQDSDGVGHPSLGTIFRIFPESGSGDFHSNHVTADLRLAADWDFAPKLSLNPNVGIARYEDNQGQPFVAGLFALTLNYLPTKKFNPFIDMGLQAPEERDGKSSLIFDTGVAYIVGHNIQLDASIGEGAHGRTPPRPFLSAGFSIRSKAASHKKKDAED